MIFRYIFSILLKVPLLLTVPLAAAIIPLFTREQVADLDGYTWGGWWGTFDNPPQGDRGYITKHAPFVGVMTGWKGYINRAMWMIRNPLYGFAKCAMVDYEGSYILSIKGNPSVSDKYGIPGWMHASLRNKGGRMKAFEWYSVTPWSRHRCLRIRLGWKIKTDKMQSRGWARMVFTANPFDGYDNHRKSAT